MRHPSFVLAPAVVAGTVLLSACGTGTAAPEATSPTASHSSHPSHGSSSMAGMSAAEMVAMSGPSAAAQMICSDEIRSVVQRTFALRRAPEPLRTWSANDLDLRCSYRLPSGTLRLSVHDAPNDRVGRPYFQSLRAALTDATALRGVQALGLPGLETPDGTVVFLKDGKTLEVDATDLPGTAAGGLTRREAAYGVASAVIACWSE